MKTLCCIVFDDLVFALLSNSSCTNFELHAFFLVPKTMHLKALLYFTFAIYNDMVSTNMQCLLPHDTKQLIDYLLIAPLTQFF